ncbi:MAG: hypothetical protein WCF21_09660 [Nitrososphaeraceae archaeon]
MSKSLFSQKKNIESCYKYDKHEVERLGGIFSYDFTCYQCKDFQTNSKSDYQQLWVKSGHPGSCYPGIADLEKHGGKLRAKNGRFS